jgi:hypothetical protein
MASFGRPFAIGREGTPLPPVFAQNLERIGVSGGPYVRVGVFLCKVLIGKG